MTTRLAVIVPLLLVGCNSNTGLTAPSDMGSDDGGCAAFRACYTQSDMSFVNCEAGFSSLAIARAGELEQCKQVTCLSDDGDASPRACESTDDNSAACKQCLDNAERGGPLGPCEPVNDPHCGACSSFVAACYGS